MTQAQITVNDELVYALEEIGHEGKYNMVNDASGVINEIISRGYYEALNGIILPDGRVDMGIYMGALMETHVQRAV